MNNIDNRLTGYRTIPGAIDYVLPLQQIPGQIVALVHDTTRETLG